LIAILSVASANGPRKALAAAPPTTTSLVLAGRGADPQDLDLGQVEDVAEDVGEAAGEVEGAEPDAAIVALSW
jgi:hypothetical protein